MKHLASGGFPDKPLMRLTLGLTLSLLGGLWASGWAMYFTRMGLSPESVRSYYLGSEAAFTNPRTLGSMLETTHAHLPVMALVLLLLTHLSIFAPYPDRAKAVFIWACFLCAAIQEGSGWLVRFVHPGFAWLKIASFVAFQTLLGGLLSLLALFLSRGPAPPPGR